jgi:hypothetical protein
MTRTLLLWLALSAGFSCASMKGQPATRQKAPEKAGIGPPAGAPSVASASAEDNAASDAGTMLVMDGSQEPDAGAARWVVFRRGEDAWHDDRLDWSLVTQGLPALSEDGTRVLVPSEEVGLGVSVNLSLRVLRVRDATVLTTTDILTESEVENAREADGGGARVLQELAERVQARVARADHDLSSEGWAPLTECKNHDPAEAAYPLCSMADQHIECGGLGVVHRQGRLDLLGPNGHAATVRVREGTVRSVVGPPDVPVRSCFEGVWIASRRKLLVGMLLQECQGGGDSCVVPSEWRVVALPFAAPLNARSEDAGR